VWEWVVADLYPMVTVVVLVRVEIVVLYLAVGVAVVVIECCPVEGGMVVEGGLFYSGKGW